MPSSGTVDTITSDFQVYKKIQTTKLLSELSCVGTNGRNFIINIYNHHYKKNRYFTLQK